MPTEPRAPAWYRRSLRQPAWAVGLVLAAFGPALPAGAQVRHRTVTVSPRKRTTTTDSTAVRAGMRKDTTAAVHVSPFSAAAAEVVRLTNVERAAVGCPPLVAHDSLAAAAMAHSTDMATHRELSHTGSDGRSAPQRALGAGYAYRMIAENVAAGQRDAAEVVRAWMNSPVHRTNMLNCELLEIGVGAARSPDDPAREIYWTQLFGIRR